MKIQIVSAIAMLGLIFIPCAQANAEFTPDIKGGPTKGTTGTGTRSH